MVVFSFTSIFPFLGYRLPQRTITHISLLGRKLSSSTTFSKNFIIGINNLHIQYKTVKLHGNFLCGNQGMTTQKSKT